MMPSYGMPGKICEVGDSSPGTKARGNDGALRTR